MKKNIDLIYGIFIIFSAFIMGNYLSNSLDDNKITILKYNFYSKILFFLNVFVTVLYVLYLIRKNKMKKIVAIIAAIIALLLLFMFIIIFFVVKVYTGN